MFVIESIESRRLLSAAGITALATYSPLDVSVSSTGTLHVTGTSKADKIAIATSGGNIVVSNNGTQLVRIAKAVKRVAVQGGAGKDSVVVDLKASIAAKLVGGKGVDRLTVLNHVGSLEFSELPASSGVYPGANGNDRLGTSPSDIVPADGLQLMAPTSGTTSQGFVALLPTDLGSQTVLQAEKDVTVPTRADNPQIKFGTFPASTVNNWLSNDVNLFAPGHGVGLVVRVEADGSATSYKYDPSADTVTVSGRSTDGIFFSSSTVANGKGGFTQKVDTVYVEDEKGTQTWKINTPAEIAEARKNSLPSNGFIVDAGKSAPDPFQTADGDGSKEKLALPGIAAADAVATMLVNSNAVNGDLSTIASGTKLTLAQARAYFDANVQSYVGPYSPSAKQPGHRELVVETPAYNGRQTKLVYNDDGTVTVTQIDASPLRLVEGVDAGTKAIVGTMFSKYEA